MPDKTRILVAEDDSFGAQSLKKTLQLLGYEVTGIAASGEEAVDKALDQQPDLIVMDITLTGEVDGIRAAKRLGKTVDIPVIYLTAHTDEGIYERAKETGPYAYLTKPYEISQLGHAIDLALIKHSMEKRLSESEGRYRTIFEAGGSALMIVDAEGRIQMVNSEFERLTGCSRQQVEQCQRWTGFLRDEDRYAVEKLISRGDREGEHDRIEASLLDNNGEAVAVYVGVRTIPGTSTSVISMSDIRELKKASNEILQLSHELSRVNADLVQEISERKRYEKQLQHQANHDSLTGLPNRVLLFELIKQSCAFEDRHNRMLALMLLDLDGFKQVNDTLGHLSGDILLKKVARRLQSCMRQYDTVGRLGGDEFVIVVNDIAMVNDIVRFAEKLQKSFEQPFDILGQPITISASIGVAIYPLHGVSVRSLLKMADGAMYDAKKAGKGMFRFCSETSEESESGKRLLKTWARAEKERRQRRSPAPLAAPPAPPRGQP